MSSRSNTNSAVCPSWKQCTSLSWCTRLSCSILPIPLFSADSTFSTQRQSGTHRSVSKRYKCPVEVLSNSRHASSSTKYVSSTISAINLSLAYSKNQRTSTSWCSSRLTDKNFFPVSNIGPTCSAASSYIPSVYFHHWCRKKIIRPPISSNA